MGIVIFIVLVAFAAISIAAIVTLKQRKAKPLEGLRIGILAVTSDGTLAPLLETSLRDEFLRRGAIVVELRDKSDFRIIQDARFEDQHIWLHAVQVVGECVTKSSCFEHVVRFTFYNVFSQELVKCEARSPVFDRLAGIVADHTESQEAS